MDELNELHRECVTIYMLLGLAANLFGDIAIEIKDNQLLLDRIEDWIDNTNKMTEQYRIARHKKCQN